MPLKGKPFGLRGQEFLLMFAMAADKLQPLREALRNAIQAGAKKIDVWTDGKSVFIGDDGCGMSPKELLTFFADFGAGKSRRTTKGDNMGIGMKISCMQLLLSLRIISRQNANSPYSEVQLGRLESGQFGQVYLDDKGTIVREVKRVPRGGYSTIVELCCEHDPLSLIRYINQRFLTLPCEVRVRTGNGDRNEAWVKCKGLLDCMREVCERTGTKEYPSCTLHWGHIPAPRKTTEFWPAPPLSYAYKEESYRSYEMRHVSLLSHWGIKAGEMEMIVLIVAKGDNVIPQIERGGVLNWDEAVARNEVCSDLPQELRDLMDVYEARHYSLNTEKEWVDCLLDNLLEGRFPGRKKPQGRDDDDEEDDDDGGGGKGGPRKSSTAPRRPGRPGYIFVDDIGQRPLQWDAAGYRVKINLKHEVIAGYLAKARTKKEERILRALIVAEVLKGWMEYHRNYDEAPEGEVLEMTIFCSIAPWLQLQMSKPLDLERLLAKANKAKKKGK